MNGISLLIAVAALGIEVGWQEGPDGRQYYTVEVEDVLLPPLEQGQAVVTEIAESDRNLRRLQVTFGEGSPRYDAADRSSSSSEMVQFGWRPGEDGGVDYMIQMSPERLNTFSKGVPIVAEVPGEVSDIRRLYIFVGLDPLPRELPDSAASQSEPQEFSQPDDGLQTVSAEVDDSQTSSSGSESSKTDDSTDSAQSAEHADSGQSGQSAESVERAESAEAAGTGESAGQRGGRYEAEPVRENQYRRFQEQSEEQAGDWQHRPESSSGAWDSGRMQRSESSSRQSQPVDSGPAYSQYPQEQGGDQQHRSRSTSGAAQRDTGQYARSERRSPQRPPPPTDSREAPRQQNFRETSSAAANNQPAASAPVAPQNSNQAAPAAPPAANWQQPYAAHSPAVAGPAAAAPQTASAARSEEEDENVRPWTPLILTTLALFASLGANAYLGWLAWSFFWRYRDAASDVARIRSASSSSRQAA